MPRICAGVEIDGPVCDGTELGVGSPGREGDADARRPSRPGLTDGRRKVGVARHHDNAITRACSGQLHESHRDADVGLLLLPAVPNATAERAPHLPPLELTEYGLDTRGLKRIEIEPAQRMTRAALNFAQRVIEIEAVDKEDRAVDD